MSDGGAHALEIDIRRKAHGDGPAALADFRLALPAGAIGALIGPSGCGKTTALRIAACLDTSFDGVVRLPAGARLGVVFQEPRLLPWRTVEENVRLAAAAHGLDPQLDGLFGRLGLAEHRRRYPAALSLGLARRAALARALAIAPDVLLLDEPFASLDPATVETLRAEIAALHDARPVTTLIVTHDRDDALALADRLFLMAGRPAHVGREVPLGAPRRDRDGAWLANAREDLRRSEGALACGA